MSSLLPACLFASLLLSDLIEADEGDDTGLPFLHKTFPVLPAPVPLYLSGGGGGPWRGVLKSFIFNRI